MQKKILVVVLAGILATACLVVVIVRVLGPRGAPQDMGPASPKSIYEETSQLINRGDYASAIKNLTAIVEKYPDTERAEAALFALGSVYEKRGELLRAKEMLEKIVEKFSASGSVEKARSELDRVNIKILFSPLPDLDSITYEVKPGDSLSKIAKMYNTTVELLMKANNLKDGTIKAGRKLKVCTRKFSIAVDKAQNILTLKSDGKVLKTYQVATGINNSSPVGTFKIVNKVVDPVWYSQNAVVPAGSPKNILGSRWMGITQPGYGIHGSTDPSSIGKQATAGCVRMHNSDVEELYAIIPVGTEVVIQD